MKALLLALACLLVACSQAPEWLTPETRAQIQDLEHRLQRQDLSEDQRAAIVARIDELTLEELQERGGWITSALAALGVPVALSDKWAWIVLVLFPRPARQTARTLSSLVRAALNAGATLVGGRPGTLREAALHLFDAVMSALSVVGLIDSTPLSKEAAQASDRAALRQRSPTR